jgi:DNA-binding NtrC family response regulator
LASLSTPVLICGESGTGKELIAKALHELGPRERQPFVVLNMGAMPKDLIESEFFGHEKGAFTGAIRKKKGAFFEAEGGTLFLDEIGELPLEGQSKLLRALDGYAVRAVGASGTGVKANVRIVAATHVDLEDRVKEGRFRHDLFYRLGVFVVNVPPLRERQEDILPIAHSILSKARELGRKELSPSAMARLMAHKWPGNVRELRNVLYRAAERTQGTGVIHCIDVDRFLRDFDTKDSRVQAAPDLARAILRDCEDNVSAAARVFGIPRTSFRRLLLRS